LTLTEQLADGTRSRTARWDSLAVLDRSGPGGAGWPALLQGVAGERFAAEQVVRSWARHDPAACWAHLLTLGEHGNPPFHLGEAALDEWARSDSRSAFDAADALPVPAVPTRQDQVRDRLRWLVVGRALEDDIAAGIALAARASDASMFGGEAFNFEHSFDRDPALACRLLSEFPDRYFRSTVPRPRWAGS
jgi:hypothetical protein